MSCASPKTLIKINTIISYTAQSYSHSSCPISKIIMVSNPMCLGDNISCRLFFNKIKYYEICIWMIFKSLFNKPVIAIHINHIIICE